MNGNILARIAVVFSAAMSFPATAEDARWQFPQQYSISPKGVNLQTGRFTYSKTDISIGDLKFVRSWGATSIASSRSIGVIAKFSMDNVPHWTPSNVGWTHNFHAGVATYSSNNSARHAVVVDGRMYTFGELSDGTIGPAEQSAQGTMLQWSTNHFIFTDRSGAIFTFLPTSNAIDNVVYSDGTRNDYAYTAGGQPKLIKSNRGYAIVMDYDGSGNVSAVCGFNTASTYVDTTTTCASASLKVSYGYDGAARNLTSVTDTLGRVATMTYTTPLTNYSFVTCISLPNSSTCEILNAYGSAPGSYTNYVDQVHSQTTATGDVWTYNFVGQPDPNDEPIVMGKPRYSQAYMYAPNGFWTDLKYDRGRLVRMMQPIGTTEYRYPYENYSVPFNSTGPATPLERFDGSPSLVTPPGGNREYFGHDNRGNVTIHSYWPKGSANPAAHPDPAMQECCTINTTPTMPTGSVTYNRTFPTDAGFTTYFGFFFVLGCGSGPADAKLCDKPITVTDAKGATTDYTYAQAHGGVLTETAPAVSGVRAQTRYTYVQRQAWVKTSSGGYVKTGYSVWLPATKSICKVGAASGAGCATGSDEVRTTYDYGPDSGPNNLLLRGIVEDSTGLSLRTCYTYDWQGNKVSETKPNAGLTTCS